MEESSVVECSPVGKLVAHHLMRHEPPYQDTGQEAHHRQEDLTRHKVEEVKQRLTKPRKMVP